MKDSKTEDKIRKLIEKLNLRDIKKRLMSSGIRGGLNWDSKKADYFIEEYKGFLFLIWKYPNKRFAPTREMDEVWHTHILFTKKYFKDCNKIFNRYIHHDPITRK